MPIVHSESLRQLATSGTISDSEVAHKISVGLDGFCTMWTEEVLPFIAAGGSELRFVEGAYGRGKTHMLRVLSKISEERGFLTCYTSCGTDSEPFESLETTYRAVAKNIRWINGGEPVIGLPRILETVSCQNLTNLRNSPQVVAPVRNLCRAYHEFRKDRLAQSSTVTDLRELLIGNNSHRVLFRELFRNNPTLPRPISKLGKRNAGQWLRSLLSLPRLLGFKGIIVMFDETGADLHMKKIGKRLRQAHMANLRNLIDHMAIGDLPGCAIVYGVTNDLLELAKADYPALAQRIERTEDPQMWKALESNPRAVWTDLDELTDPQPPSVEFFVALGQRLVSLANETGSCQKTPREVEGIIRKAIQQASETAQDDSIRVFVKRIAGSLLT